MLGFFSYFNPIYRQENGTLEYIIIKCVLGRQISKAPPTPSVLSLNIFVFALPFPVSAREIWLSLLGLKDIKKENTFLEK